MNIFSDNITKLDSINRRMFIITAAKMIIFGGIISRMFFLQVKQNDKYLTLSDKNRIREWKLAPVRGDFTDYFGNIIAGNFEAYELHMIPEEVEDFRYTIYRIKDLGLLINVTIAFQYPYLLINDQVPDDPLFIDKVGYSCNDWENLNCNQADIVYPDAYTIKDTNNIIYNIQLPNKLQIAHEYPQFS